MNDNIQKKQPQKITTKQINQAKKQFPLEKFKHIVNNITYVDDCRPYLEKIHNELCIAYAKQDKKEIKKGQDKIMEKIGKKVPSTYTLYTRFHLVNAVGKENTSAALQMCDELEAEYNVQSPSEKALVQMVVLNFFRALNNQQLFNMYDNPQYISHERAHFVSIYSKEIDKAQRQFISTIETLKALKDKPIKVTVKANNAFIAENQQNIDANHTHNEPQ